VEKQQQNTGDAAKLLGTTAKNTERKEAAALRRFHCQNKQTHTTHPAACPPSVNGKAKAT